MSWKDLVCLCIVIIGVVLFLYGSNYYNASIGWSGVYLIIAGLLAETILTVYESIKKKGD
jgi:drug/metabolite transporter (DMT)-like permease